MKPLHPYVILIGDLMLGIAIGLGVGFKLGEDSGAKKERAKLVQILEGLKMKPWEELEPEGAQR